MARTTMPRQSAPEGTRRSRSPWRTAVQVFMALVGAAIVVYAVVWSYSLAVSQLGPFAPLAAALVGGLLLAVLGPWLLVHYHRQLHAALGRALAWVGARLAATGLPQRFARRYPRLARFLVARFTPGSPTGLPLTVWIVIALALVEQVVELLVEVVSGRQAGSRPRASSSWPLGHVLPSSTRGISRAASASPAAMRPWPPHSTAQPPICLSAACVASRSRSPWACSPR
jgi:hypothetical protein